MDFFLFLLVNAALFIRPSELIPATLGWPIYNYLILATLLVAAPAVINQLSERSLAQSPITVCVLGVWVFIALSQLAKGEMQSAWNYGYEFSKVVAYFLLLVGVVNTPRRLVVFLAAVVAFALVVNVIAVLQYHGIIELTTLQALDTINWDVETEVATRELRMRGTGIFGDPNDLSVIINACIIICAAGFFCRQLGIFRFALAVPAGFLFYCLTLTQSRGGLLAFLVGCAVLGYSWLGAVRAGLVGVAGLPVVLMRLGGRQLDFAEAMSGGTGRSRVELWSSGLEMFKGSPIFGLGCGNYAEYAGQVAHNSFVHAFGELGFLGGMMFLGVFAVAAWLLWSLRAVRREIVHPGLAYLLPFLLALVVTFCASMMTLSRGYDVSTYMIAGIVVCYDRLARPGTSLRPLLVNGSLLKWLATASVAFIAVTYLYIKFFFR